MNVRPMNEIEQSPVDMPGAAHIRMRMLVGPADSAKNFHMRQFEIAPGGHSPRHQHDYEHEILILGGRGIAKSDAGDRPFKAGDVIWVPPNELHQFVNTGPDPLSFICLIPAPQDCST
ncbi:MAG: cupin domain-containing protein [Phycisphaerae bacterium]